MNDRPESGSDAAVLLDVKGLRAGYKQAQVLDNIDLTVYRGQFSVVIGPNGHGKTTLLRAISGLVTPRSGSIQFAGERIDTLRPEAIVRRGVIHIPQGDLVFPDMTVAENLALGAFTREAQKTRVEKLEQVYAIFPRLAERSKQRARTLSGGERRMLAIGRGMMGAARILMIDEPSLGLAPVLVEEVYQQIGMISSTGLTVLLVEENFSRVRDIADHVTLIENGGVALSGTVDAVLSDPVLAATYLGMDS